MFKDIIKQVDKDRIYKIITDLEGPRHPLYNMDALNAACDYICNKLETFGISYEIQEFYVKGMDEPFKNIIGFIGDRSKPATLIGSHYDTVKDCPGANDNLSAVSVSLEVARLLMTQDNPPSTIIGIFTLEEGHPGIQKTRIEQYLKHKIIDNKGKFASFELLNVNKTLNKKIKTFTSKGKTAQTGYRELLIDCKLSGHELKLAEINRKIYDEYEADLFHGTTILLGSSVFVSSLDSQDFEVSSIINYDCLGWIKSGHLTQKKLPISKEMDPFIKRNKLDLENYIGNYIAVMGDINSSKLVNSFLDHCKDDLDIAYMGMDLPLNYDQIKVALPDSLRADHAPFWKAGIPGIFISDMANFRSELYHTPADESQHIDYDMLSDIAKATLKYLLSDS